MNESKIALGTAQFGMDYGINNKRGRIPRIEVFDILNEASRSGIDTVDTAHAYGESETVIGEFIQIYGKRFKIISKIPLCEVHEVKSMFESSLQRFNVDAVYGYLFHSFQHYKEHPEILNIIENLKSEGNIEKIGFSLYFPTELDYILNKKIDFDIVQVPYSIFDQRFAQYFQELDNKGVEIHIRSVFLQGLVFKDPEELGEYFSKIKEKMVSLHSLSIRQNIPIVALCLNFVALNNFLDRIVVGVDSISNLKEIISSLQYITDVKNIFDELSSFNEEDEKIILPFYWKGNKP